MYFQQKKSHGSFFKTHLRVIMLGVFNPSKKPYITNN